MKSKLTTQQPDAMSLSADIPAQPPRLRLEFLDGLRGLAAFYVVLFHAYQLTTFDNPRVDAALVWRIGHPAVPVFIVLSGFCLMLPVARSPQKELRGGARNYFKRRAWRVLPPYYAALVLSSLFLAAAHAAKYHSFAALSDRVLAVQLSAGSLISHLFLVHNFSPVWIETLDVPMWSVATEWQIYFFLPALLLPVWRRLGGQDLGLLGIIAAGFAAGLLPHYLLPPSANLDWACPWYLGLFATGMAGAAFAFSQPSMFERKPVPWRRISFVLFVALAALLTLVPDAIISRHVWETDALAGGATTCLILACTGETAMPLRRHAVLRALEVRPVLGLGAFSYSLYLIHYPVLNKIALFLAARHLPLLPRLAVMGGLGVPLALGISYLFYLGCEKRFSDRSRAARPAEIVVK